MIDAVQKQMKTYSGCATVNINIARKKQEKGEFEDEVYTLPIYTFTLYLFTSLPIYRLTLYPFTHVPFSNLPYPLPNYHLSLTLYTFADLPLPIYPFTFYKFTLYPFTLSLSLTHLPNHPLPFITDRKGGYRRYPVYTGRCVSNAANVSI